MRMHMRRFTRLTNAFSKKFMSHVHMVALYTVFYNFIRLHKSLRVTPSDAGRDRQSGLRLRGHPCEDRCKASANEAGAVPEKAASNFKLSCHSLRAPVWMKRRPIL
jgi:hypothetical protein